MQQYSTQLVFRSVPSYTHSDLKSILLYCTCIVYYAMLPMHFKSVQQEELRILLSVLPTTHFLGKEMLLRQRWSSALLFNPFWDLIFLVNPDIVQKSSTFLYYYVLPPQFAPEV